MPVYMRVRNAGAVMPSIIPVNYRTHEFHLCGVDLNIGGMAAPDGRNPDVDGALTYLVENEQMNVLIGLKEESFAEEARAKGLEYHHLPIPDYSEPSPAKYNAIYAVVKKATEEGKRVTIHCGAGNGRSGAALSSLKMRELIEKAAKTDLLVLDETPALSVSVYVSMDKREIPCTPFVKMAIEQLRVHRLAPDNAENGSHSVETNIDVQALIAYERFIKRELKQSLGLQLDDLEVEVTPEIKSYVVPINSTNMMLLKMKQEKAIQTLKTISLAPPPSSTQSNKKKAPVVEKLNVEIEKVKSDKIDDPFKDDPFADTPFKDDDDFGLSSKW